MTLPPDAQECRVASAALERCIAVPQAAAASETLASASTAAATTAGASTTAARGMRRLAQEGEAGAATSTSKLSPACDALVRLAEPGDVYAHYNRAMSAAAVSTQIKAIEQRLGLKVGCPLLPGSPHVMRGCTVHGVRHPIPELCRWICSGSVVRNSLVLGRPEVSERSVPLVSATHIL